MSTAYNDFPQSRHTAQSIRLDSPSSRKDERVPANENAAPKEGENGTDSTDTPEEVSELTRPVIGKSNMRDSNKGGKSHRDAYKENHARFVKLLIEGRPLVEIQTLLGLKKGQMDKHSYDAFSEGVVPGKPKYRCSRWEDLGDEEKAIMTNGLKGRLVKIEGDSDSVMITFYDPQADIN